jgi:hypothetical protein
VSARRYAVIPRRHWPSLVLAAGGYGALTIFLTWPLTSAPARLSIPIDDALGHMWALAWVAHQAVRDPLRIYDANMYWPYSLSLAYTESLLPQALLASPVFLLGGGPLLAHNLVLLATLVLSGVTAYLLALDLTRSRPGAWLAGIAYAFGAFQWCHIVHLGVLSIEWFPLVVLFLRRSVRRATTVNLIGLAVASAMQALSSGYYAVLLAVTIATVGAFYLPAALRRRTWPKIGGSLVLAALIVLPAALPYRELQQRHRIARSRAVAVRYSAQPKSYLDPGAYIGSGSGFAYARDLYWWTRTDEPLYQGFAVLLLAVAGLTRWHRSEGARLAALLAAVGFALSLGPEVQLGSWALPAPFDALRRIPPANMVRGPGRFGALALLGIALLAGVGWARLSGRLPAFRRPALLAVSAVSIVAIYPFDLADSFRETPRPRPFVWWLAAAERGPVLELPWDHEGGSGLYLYWSTWHWQPMINGHGTFTAPGRFELGNLGRRFPALHASRILRRAGIRYVVVHLDGLSAGQRHRLVSAVLPEGVSLAADFGLDRIYGLEPPESAGPAN